MSEILKSKHGFGKLAGLDSAIADGKLDAYDILFLDGDSDPKIGWIDKDGNPIILPNKNQVIKVDVLPDVGAEDVVYICASRIYVWDGEKFVPPTDCEGVTEEQLGDAVDALKAYTDTAAGDANTYTDEAVAGAKEHTEALVSGAKDYTDTKAVTLEKVRYELTSKPAGTIVRYGDREIRILCAADTQWELQSGGGDANLYYLGFRAYAPEGTATFKEGLGALEDTVFDFTDDYSGVDEYGRKYSVIWLPAAIYDSESGWSYYGDMSSSERYIGWDYFVEWYDADGVLLDADKIRINLSNASCHYESVDSTVVDTVNEAVAEANAYTDQKIAESTVTVVEF